MKNLINRLNLLVYGEPKRPKVGLGVVIVKGNTILLGTRKGSHCEGQRCVPGGHLEYGETLQQGCLREVSEETGLTVQIRPFDPFRVEWHVANNILEGKHYVGIFLVADWIGGEPKLMEPDKCNGWEWVPYSQVIKLSKPGCAWLPSELFVPYQYRLLKYPVGCADNT